MLAADEDADFTVWAAQAWPGLYRRAFLLAGQHADAEDVAQQTLIRVRRHWTKVVRAGSPEAYVTRILTNVYLSSRQRSRIGREVLRAVPDVPVVAPATPAHGDLWPHLLMLAPRQRAVLVLRFYEDLAEREVAEILGISVGTVKSTTHKALAHLRVALERELA
jgi:RNA polymerase sigma-70 factor (sigma-E family)